MTIKKFFGYMFMVVATILTIVIIGLLPKLLELVLDIFMIFTSSMDSYQTASVMGTATYWAIYITLTIILWIYGSKWIKNKTVD